MSAALPLMRGLIDRLGALDAFDASLEGGRRLVAVLIDQPVASAALALHLPVPRDKRLANDPASFETIDQWVDRIGMAGRTLTRRFVAEIGCSGAGKPGCSRQWRCRAWASL